MAKYNAFELRKMLLQGQAMKNPAGDPSYPIADEDDLQSAIHAVGRGGASANAIRKYIMGRAKALGKSSMIPDTWNADGSLGEPASGPARSAVSDMQYTRSFALEECSIRAGGDGRTVDAYAAIFNTPATIQDPDGVYEEVIDPAAFNRAIEHAQRSGRSVPVMFNHGLTMYHTPSELGSMPIGVAEEIRADSRGLFTRSRYNKTPLAEAALENIRDGSITAYSFQGSFKRSDPAVPRGGFRRQHDGSLRTVRRTESTLKEYGPTPFPAYAGAEVVGVRAEQAAMLLASLNPSEFGRLASILSGTPSDPPDIGTTSDEVPAADDPPARHSTRSPRQIAQAQRAAFIIRHGGH